jgi:thiopurine S-methyltransferase
MSDIKTSEYWQHRYETASTGWDIGYPAPALTSYIDALPDKSIKILIPGCGNAWEVEYLWKKGFRNIWPADIAESPKRNFLARVTDFPEEQWLCGDVLDMNGEYNLILEQTFFCALDPSLRRKYAASTHRLLQEGGKLAGLLFEFPMDENGPPFGGSKAEYRALFEPYFDILQLDDCLNSIKPREGREVFIELRKKAKP